MTKTYHEVRRSDALACHAAARARDGTRRDVMRLGDGQRREWVLLVHRADVVLRNGRGGGGGGGGGGGAEQQQHAEQHLNLGVVASGKVPVEVPKTPFVCVHVRSGFRSA